jgi:hypothetical protein
MRTLTLPWSFFTLVKYAVYAVLCINLVLFILEDHGSFRNMAGADSSVFDVVGIFAQSIDTAAWVALLLLFELETAVIPHASMTAGRQRLVHAVRLLCAATIVYAFAGYVQKALGLMAFEPLQVMDACAFGEGFSALIRLDGYESLTALNCSAYPAPLLGLPGTQVIATAADHSMTSQLAWLDVVNAGTWILIVVMLEVDVRLQSKHLHALRWQSMSRVVKSFFYGVLFVAATLWGLAGTWLDFIDAALWLFAFFCIELNVFAWAREDVPAHTSVVQNPME